jgi:hypothetical protein
MENTEEIKNQIELAAKEKNSNSSEIVANSEHYNLKKEGKVFRI